MSKAKDKDSLSTLGKKAEKALTTQLDLITKDMSKTDSKYSLTDFMKVMDRVLKLEAIKAKTDDTEGDFFTNRGDEE